MRERALALVLGALLLMGAQVERAEGQTRLIMEFQAPPVVSAFIEDPTFVTGFFGPLGCAKTTAGVMKSWGYGQVYPGARILVSRVTWPALRATTQKAYFEWLRPGVLSHYEATTKTLWVPHPKGAPVEILFRALDDSADISNVLSLDLAAAHLDEPQGGVSTKEDGSLEHQPGLKKDLFDAILGRLGRQRGYPGMVWLTGNPPSPTHWIATEFDYEPGESGCDPPRNRKEDFRLYLGTQETNRHNLPPGYYERLSRLYGRDTPMARRFIYGLWIDFASEKPFKLADIEVYGDEGGIVLPGGLIVEAGVDPAISKKDTAATTAIVVAGQCRRGSEKGRIFELFHEEGHWSPYETVDHMLKTQRQWKVRIWRIEDVAYQRALGDTLEHEARLAGLHVNVDLVQPDADKIRRANAWSPMVEDATILFRDRQSALVKAMLAIPQNVRAWNLVDAAGICFRGFPRIQPEMSRLPEFEHQPTRAASYATRSASAVAAEPVVAPASPSQFRPGPFGRTAGPRRAAGYAVRPRSSR